MNVELINQLIDWLKDGAKHVDANGNSITFDMRQWQVETDCGTSCCLAGATVQFGDPKFALHQLFLNDGVDEHLYSPTQDRAQELLEIDSRQAQALFIPWDGQDMGIWVRFHDPSPENAIHALETLRDTGTPVWRERL